MTKLIIRPKASIGLRTIFFTYLIHSNTMQHDQDFDLHYILMCHLMQWGRSHRCFFQLKMVLQHNLTLNHGMICKCILLA